MTGLRNGGEQFIPSLLDVDPMDKASIELLGSDVE
jgi:hypothetical protein